MAQDDGNLKVIISRIQQRRGLKQDLPQPLRPGEIGFATDSQQVYIGADTENSRSSVNNKTVYLENTLGASARALSIANTQIIKFTVPHIRWPKGSNSFEGVSKTKSWYANTDITANAGVADGSNTIVTRGVFDDLVSSNSYIKHAQTGRAFDAEDITLIINGVKQKGDRTSSSVLVNAAFDYNFISGSDPDSDHVLNLKTAPSNSDDVAVTYYSNTHVHNILSNAVISSGANLTGFYANASIPSYREIDNDLVLINSETGTGFIGLEAKHIDIVAEGKGVLDTSSLTTGNIVVAKDPTDPALFDSDGVYSGIGNVTATVTQDLSDPGNTDLNFISFSTISQNLRLVDSGNSSIGSNGFVYLEGEPGSIVAGGAGGIAERNYLHQRLMPVLANSSGTTFTTSIPGNAFTTVRAVSNANVSESANLVTLVGASLSGIDEGDKLYLLDPTANNLTLDGNVFTVDRIVNGNIILLPPDSNTLLGVGQQVFSETTTNSNISFVNYGTTNGEAVQIVSNKHSLPVANTTIVADVAVAGYAAGTVITPQSFNDSTNAFYIPANTTVTEAVTGNWYPVLSDVSEDDALTVSEAYHLNIGSSTLNGVLSTINGKNIWLKASLKPDVNDEIYLQSDDRRQYLLLDDPTEATSSWEEIGITPRRYTRSDDTVKAKLENWLYLVTQDEKVNVITDIFCNDLYTSDNTVINGFNSWFVDLDPTTSEITFDSNDEAGNFATIVNKLYFKSNDPDKRGLINLKTNIELLTTSALESGQAETVYAQPLELSIGSNTSVQLTDLGSDTNSYDTLFIDYSIVGQAADASNSDIRRYYNRVGTLVYHGNPSAMQDANGIPSGSVILQDLSSESMDDYFTGNLTFNATINSDIVSITANNSLSPTTSNVIMKYVVRKWKSQ